MNIARIIFRHSTGAVFLCAVSIVLHAGGCWLEAGPNLEEKIKYERALEQKVEEMLSSLLGPGKGKVMVQASIDFSSRESVTSLAARGDALPLPEVGAGGANAPWWADMMENLRAKAPGEPESAGFSRETLFPQYMVKSLTVSLVLSESLSDAEVQKVRGVVSNMLGLDVKRGDEILIMKAGFAPVWYTPEMFNMLVKYGLLAFILVVAMGIVGVGFLKMAGAMNSMAGTGQQKISMEMNAGGAGEARELVPGQADAGLPRYLAGAVEEPGNSTENPEAGAVFNVPAEKLSILVGMLAKDDPADIALILMHLPPGLRSRFISMFPVEKGSEIVASVAKVRFVDLDMIAKIKEELERRLSGAVGGYERALEVIGSVDVRAKKALYENLRKNHPEIAARVRSTMIFLEDIEKLTDKDLAILIGTVSVEQWALAAWELSAAARERLKAQMAKRSWQMLEQSMKYGRPPENSIEKASENVVLAVWRLISESRISNPNADAQAGIDYKPVLGEPVKKDAPVPVNNPESDELQVSRRRDFE
ncbi:MAG: hypothetical protein A2285_03715 [Elusimicrobia bacterium RIFOXYA12_FULL_57_11]|nr:MAG: hypothetical protein A2285_03715 [Elusimicrobia bacterium RIFOXYA12_FULL_57_11]